MFALLALWGCAEDRVDAILALEGDPIEGSSGYAARCELCHGPSGEGGTGPSIAGEAEEQVELVEVILYGEGEMSGFEDLLADQEVADIVAFVQSGFATPGCRAATTTSPCG